MKPEHVIVGGGSTMGTGAPVISDAVRWGDLVLLSGRAAVDQATLTVTSPEFEPQARAVLADIGTVLGEVGSSWSHVLRVEAYLAHSEDFAAWNRVWTDHFTPPRPARTTIVTGFGVPGILIELQVTAGIEAR